MNEEQFARQITSSLDRGLNQLRPDVTRRLERARTLALSHVRHDIHAQTVHTQHSLSLTGWMRQHRTGAMVSLLTILLLAILGLWQNPTTSTNDDTTDVDAALLTGDLPVKAYLDNHLNQQWSNRDSN